MVSENEFYVLNGNRYRGSRYANFTGGGTDPQGNVSPATNEDAANSIGTYYDATSAPVPGTALTTTGGASQNLIGDQASSASELLKIPTIGQAAKDLVIGSALPYAGKTIGQAAGTALAGGATTGEALKTGAQSLTSKVTGASANLVGNLAGSNLSAATNSALGGLGNTFGPATASQVATAAPAASGSSLPGVGGAAGVGLGTAAATLLTGGSAKDAALSGLGSGAGYYAGTAIGTAIGGPAGAAVGGFLGSTIGSFFCFTPETPILMEDGKYKAAGDIKLGDVVFYGGMVTARGEAFACDVHAYKGTLVTGGHAVFENGKWLRIEDSELASYKHGRRVVCPIETENHILITPFFVSADISEIDDDIWNVTEDERISILNDMLCRNNELSDIEGKYCIGSGELARESA